MKHHYVSGVRITGVACAVPKNVVPNTDTRAAGMVGVKERRFVDDGGDLLCLAEAASHRLLADMHWAPQAVDALVFVTQTSPRRMPSIACELHEELGLPHHVPAFDLNMACSGYTYGLWVSASLRLPRVLLVVGDTISRFLDPLDASTYPIFGDAVSATALELTGDPVGIDFVGGTAGSGADGLCILDTNQEFEKHECYRRETLHMDGAAVFHFALSTVPGLITETTLNAYTDWVLMHQANKSLVEAIAKKAKVDLARVPMNLSRYGNTSSASIPLLMCDSEATEALRTRKNVVAMFGFGAGWSMAGVRTEVEALNLSLVEI